MRKLLCAILAGTMLLSLCACDTTKPVQTTNPNITEPTTQPEIPIEPINLEDMNIYEQAMALYKLSATVANEDNIMVSPVSINYALAMLAAGSDTETKAELLKYFGTDDIQTILDDYKAYMESLDETVEIANSVWFENEKADITLNKDYAKTMKDYLNAEVNGVDFADSKTVKTINAWVNDKTHGMIPEIVSELSPQTVMALINALYFENKWAKEFDAESTTDKDFTLADGSTKSVPMMRGKVYEYLHTENATGFIKDYKGGRYAFVGILPNEDTSFDEINLQELLNSKENTSVHISMPRFTFDYSTSLNDVLKAMGLTSMFDSEKADLSNAVTSEGQNVYVSNVIHKTKIELTESGTKAAAVTAIIMEATSAMTEKPKEVNLNRPFMFLILDKQNNSPLFVGSVANPS